MNKTPLFFLILLACFYACQESTKSTESPIAATSSSQDSSARNQRVLKIVQTLDSLKEGDKVPHSFMLELVSCAFGNFEPQTNFEIANEKNGALELTTPRKAVSKLVLNGQRNSWIRVEGESWNLNDSLSNNVVAIYENEFRKRAFVGFEYTDIDADSVKELCISGNGLFTGERYMYFFEQKDTFWEVACVLWDNFEVVGTEEFINNRSLLGGRTGSSGWDYDYNYENEEDSWNGSAANSLHWHCYKGDSLKYLGQFLECSGSSDDKNMAEKIKSFDYFRESQDVVLSRPHTDTLLYQYIVKTIAQFEEKVDTSGKVMFYNIDLATSKDKAVDTVNKNIVLNCDTIQQLYVWDNQIKQFKYRSTKSISPYLSVEKARKLVEPTEWENALHHDTFKKRHPGLIQYLRQHGTRAQRLILPFFEKEYNY